MKGDPKKGRALLDRMASGREFDDLDETPIEMPLGASHPTPLADLIASMVKTAVEQQTGDDFDTPEEADDFEEEDPDTLDLTRYEFEELPDESFDPPEEEPLEQPEPDDKPPTGDDPDPNDPEPG